MVSGSATTRSALVERTLAKMAARLAETAGLEPGSPELQALLKLGQDGIFGPRTKKAVQQFQQMHNLFPDGVVGTYTWKALLR
jgi:peptidoglycan hydrolase-like protein with peptidoglycan-binding domain